MEMIDLLFLQDAFLEFEPAFPLDARRPRGGILERLGSARRLYCFELGVLWELFLGVDAVLVERGCLKFVDGFGFGELEEETCFDCYDFTPGLKLELTRIREEKLELSLLGVLPGFGAAGRGSGGVGMPGRPKRKTRRGKKKAKKIGKIAGCEMEASDDGILESDSVPSQSEGSYRDTPRTTPPSSPGRSCSGEEGSLQFLSSSVLPEEPESDR